MDRVRKLTNRLKAGLAALNDDSDFFRPMELFLLIGGIHLPTKNATCRRLFYCYRALVAIQLFVWINRLYVALFEWNNPGDLIGVVCFFVALVAIFSRVGTIRLYLNELQAVRQYLGSQLNEHRTEKRDRSFRLIHRIALVLEVTFFVDQIVFHAFGIGKDRLFRVPDNLSRLDWRVTMFIEVAIASNHFVLSSIYVTTLTVMNSLLMALDTELQEIVLQFETIFERVEHERSEMISQDERLKKHPGLRKGVEKELLWKITKQELSLAVSKHAKLLIQFEALGNYFKLSFLSMFYMDIVSLSCAAFYIREMGLTMNTVILASYTAAHLLESYWFCYLSDNLSDANEQIGDALYELDWHQRLQMTPDFADEYREIRTSMLVVMIKSRQGLGLSCGGMFEMSAEAFYELLKMIYSFLMFLINTTTDDD